MTEEQIIVLSILQDRWPDETDLLGEDVLAGVVRDRDMRHVTTGASADLASVVAVLLSAVTLLKQSIEIIKLKRELTRKTPSVQEVQAELARRLADPRPEYGIPTDALIAELLRRLPRE